MLVDADPANYEEVSKLSIVLSNSKNKSTFRIIRDGVHGMRLKQFGPITHVSTALNVAALTFDDGPHPEYTPQLLAILRRYKAKATFFMVGETAERYPDVVKMVAEDGHVIGNHSWNHPVFTDISGQERRRQIHACSKTLWPYEAKLFRPPYGCEHFRSHLDARLLGYLVVKWNIAVVDWETYSADWIADNVIAQISPGCIILLHDNLYGATNPCRKPTLKAVEKLLCKSSKTFQFRSVADLFTIGKPESSCKAIGRTAPHL
jgi:peptidoglycan/xylan/chitin deacetylase (PgdA/CDA1 family)